MDKLTKEFEKLRSITPDSFYTKNSRQLILNSRRKDSPIFLSLLSESLKFSSAMALTVFLIVIIIGGFAYLQKSPLPLQMAGLDLTTLKAEAEEMSIDIKLAKLEYYNQNPINTALEETTQNKPAQFHNIILEKEIGGFDLEIAIEEENIDNALNELVK